MSADDSHLNDSQQRNPQQGDSQQGNSQPGEGENLSEASSPCIGLCELDRELGLCKGCLRTLREITAWGTLPIRRRREVLGHVERRSRDPKVLEQIERWEAEARGG